MKAYTPEPTYVRLRPVQTGEAAAMTNNRDINLYNDGGVLKQNVAGTVKVVGDDANDQSLNTTDDVTFDSVTATTDVKTNTISPRTGTVVRINNATITDYSGNAWIFGNTVGADFVMNQTPGTDMRLSGQSTEKVYSYDSAFQLWSSATVTGKLNFSIGSAAGTTRTMTTPNYDFTVASLAGTETLSNKTFVAPVLGEATATSVTTPLIYARNFPMYVDMCFSNLSANQTYWMQNATNNTHTTVVVPTNTELRGCYIHLDTTTATEAEGSYTNTEYTTWTTGTFSMYIRTSVDDAATNSVFTICTGVTKAATGSAPWFGRRSKSLHVAISPSILVAAGSQLFVTMTTDASWNGTGLDGTVSIYGFIQNY